MHSFQNDIWKPDLTLRNSFVNFKQMGLASLNVEISNNGDVEWYPFEVYILPQ